FCCEHRTRHITWRPELLGHANGAVALEHVLAVSAEPRDDAAQCARLFASEVEHGDDGASVVETGNATIRFYSKRSLAQHFAGVDLADAPASGLVGLVLETVSLADTRAALAAGGVRSSAIAEGVAIAPADACGVLLVFVER
ncbi:MAG: hypothetical protein JO090_13585, partial [Rhizobacter sp.]|nr:hypothetical protein [Rhizobacter sp.]